MSDTDSFIEEVTEEVRRDKLYGYVRKYGWVAALLIVIIVGSAAYFEYQRAQAEAEAQALGDAMLEALSQNEDSARAAALSRVNADTPEGSAVLAFMRAGARAQAGDVDGAVEDLILIETNANVPLVYRQIAAFKSLLVQSDTLDAESRRAGFQALAVPGVPLRLLAEEQIALIEVETGDPEAAISRMRGLLEDAEATAGLQRRALQAIVALGGSPTTDTEDN